MQKKRKAFYATSPDGKRRKVKPDGRRFRGDNGDHYLSRDTVVDGNLFVAGYYPFVFWESPSDDRHDSPSSHHDTSQSPVPTPSYTPEPSHHAHVGGSSSGIDGGGWSGGHHDSGSSSHHDSGGSSGSSDGGSYSAGSD